MLSVTEHRRLWLMMTTRDTQGVFLETDIAKLCLVLMWLINRAPHC